MLSNSSTRSVCKKYFEKKVFWKKYFTLVKILFESILKIQNKILSINYFKIKMKYYIVFFQSKDTIFKIEFCPSQSRSVNV